MLEKLTQLMNMLRSIKEDPRIRLLSIAQRNIGQKITKNIVYGCAEAVNEIHSQCFGTPIGGGLSTIGLYTALCQDKSFCRVFLPLPGDIIITPTVGKNTGHTGYILFSNQIASNSSISGRFIQNYTLSSWSEYFVKQKGLQTYYFRKVN